MSKVTFNVAALCDKAGRKMNQDNIYLSCMDNMRSFDAGSHTEMLGDGLTLPPEGTVLVVADGMGGMNAGEVASQIVVETLGREVSALAGQPLTDTERASAVARRAIADADNAIKQYVSAHPEAAGTGSTIVLLWLLGDKAVVAWCGDSRCYRYNDRRGLEQLSHDHSYVQRLVDEGKLPPQLAFGHEQSNIITRCLSDDKQPAEPDVKVFDVYKGDMFLLCSDGLCGLLPDDVTEELLRSTGGNVVDALQTCWRRGSEEKWSDNVSIILAAVDGVETVAPVRKVAPLPKVPSYSDTLKEADEAADPNPIMKSSPIDTMQVEVDDSGRKLSLWRWLPWVLLCVAVGVIISFVVPRKPKPDVPQHQEQPAVVENDTHGGQQGNQQRVGGVQANTIDDAGDNADTRQDFKPEDEQNDGSVGKRNDQRETIQHVGNNGKKPGKTGNTVTTEATETPEPAVTTAATPAVTPVATPVAAPIAPPTTTTDEGSGDE